MGVLSVPAPERGASAAHNGANKAYETLYAPVRSQPDPRMMRGLLARSSPEP